MSSLSSLTTSATAILAVTVVPVKTPVLDGLAADGVRFTDFHSGAPVCSPSRATFLTGRNHIRAGVYSVLSEQRHKNASASERNDARRSPERRRLRHRSLRQVAPRHAHPRSQEQSHSRPNMALTTGSAWSMGLIPLTKIPPTFCATANPSGP